ncbi:MAG: MlaD family protein, partial [Acidobacteria bacterium]|nr:MlaD family protein [Acidobacteriota bacterium]MDW7983365.1 MlaD family protein [Acidobacteriota bacterium]
MQVRRHLGWRDVLVGLSIALGMFLLMVGIIAVGGQSGGFWAPKATYYTDLPEASGLYVGSIVMIDGVEVGSVRRIDFNPEGPGIRVYYWINARYQDRIRQDSVVSVRSLGLLGDRYLYIQSGHPSQPVIPAGRAIRAVAVADYGELATQVSERLADLKVTLDRANQVMDQIVRAEGVIGALINDPALKQDVKTTVHALAAGKGSLGKLIQDDRLYRELVQITERLQSRDSIAGLLLQDREQARQMTETLGRLHRIVTNLEQGQGSAGKLLSDEKLYAELTQVVVQMNQLLDPQQNPDGTLQQILRDPSLYRDLHQAVRDVRQLIADIRRDPRKYL